MKSSSTKEMFLSVLYFNSLTVRYIHFSQLHVSLCCLCSVCISFFSWHVLHLHPFRCCDSLLANVSEGVCVFLSSVSTCRRDMFNELTKVLPDVENVPFVYLDV